MEEQAGLPAPGQWQLGIKLSSLEVAGEFGEKVRVDRTAEQISTKISTVCDSEEPHLLQAWLGQPARSDRSHNTNWGLPTDNISNLLIESQLD